MGFFDFLTGAGKKIEEEKPPAQKTATPEEFAAARARLRNESLRKLVGDNSLAVKNLGIKADGETVVVTGEADTQETREKVVLLIGNVHGVGRVDDQLTVAAPPTPAAVFHTVASGETLGKIAKTYYGKSSAYMQIFEANKPMLSDPDKIYPGQVLRIPNANPPAEKA